LKKTIISLLILSTCLTAGLTASAQKARGRAAWAWTVVSNETVWKVTETTNSTKPTTATTESCPNALAEVNEYRAKRGLPPFQHDPQLTEAALTAAQARANHLWAGHLQSDFACLPAGAHADSAGCGALDDSWGWATCCMDDNYSHAGAAWVRGSDGKRYMHLFVRGSKVVETFPDTTKVSTGDCSTGSCGSAAQSSRRGLFSRRR